MVSVESYLLDRLTLKEETEKNHHASESFRDTSLVSMDRLVQPSKKPLSCR